MSGEYYLSGNGLTRHPNMFAVLNSIDLQQRIQLQVLMAAKKAKLKHVLLALRRRALGLLLEAPLVTHKQVLLVILGACFEAALCLSIRFNYEVSSGPGCCSGLQA